MSGARCSSDFPTPFTLRFNRTALRSSQSFINTVAQARCNHVDGVRPHSPFTNFDSQPIAALPLDVRKACGLPASLSDSFGRKTQNFLDLVGIDLPKGIKMILCPPTCCVTHRGCKWSQSYSQVFKSGLSIAFGLDFSSCCNTRSSFFKIHHCDLRFDPTAPRRDRLLLKSINRHGPSRRPSWF
jgi:hypothetical protein